MAAPPLVLPDATARIRAAHAAAGRRIAVLDDDPTGSQSVHGVPAVLALEPDQYAAALREHDLACFVLTNTRSLAEPDAVARTARVADDLLAAGRRAGLDVALVSRSDSTLRGHLLAEVAALDAARRRATGRGYDGVLLVPAYLEAGRATEGDVHRALVGGRWLPVAETEFARDATFGYSSSDLRDLLVELSRGRIARDDVLSLSLDDIRGGGPDRVAAVLSGARDGRFVVVNATSYADLEVAALGWLAAERAGRTFLHRTGPSFVRALAGLDARAPLTSAQIRDGLPGEGRVTRGHGLVVVGSHVGLTTGQLAVLRARGGLTEATLDVRAVLDPGRHAAHVADVTGRVLEALRSGDVLLATTRERVTGPDAAASLDVARRVSRALTDVVRGALAARPRWVVAKGGITSHDVAVRALGIRRAVVVGQLLPGMVSVLRPVDAPDPVRGVPLVVFAGNVGDERTLADVVDRVRGAVT